MSKLFEFMNDNRRKIPLVIIQILRDAPREGSSPFGRLFPKDWSTRPGGKSVRHIFTHELQRLIASGVIEAMRTEPLGEQGAQRAMTRYRLSEAFHNIQSAIGFSVSEHLLRDGGSLVVRPVFGAPHTRPIDVFAVMPFRGDLDGVYAAICAASKALKLTPARGDDVFGSAQVVHDVWSNICSAKAVVCDCTGKNANVFYELGVAHSVGRPVTLIAQNSADIPFDLRHWRYLIYENTPAGLKKLKMNLVPFLKSDVAHQRDELFKHL